MGFFFIQFNILKDSSLLFYVTIEHSFSKNIAIYDLHAIKFTHLKYIVQQLSVYLKLGGHHRLLEYSHHPQRNHMPISSHSQSPLPLMPCLTTTDAQSHLNYISSFHICLVYSLFHYVTLHLSVFLLLCQNYTVFIIVAL